MSVVASVAFSVLRAKVSSCSTKLNNTTGRTGSGCTYVKVLAALEEVRGPAVRSTVSRGPVAVTRVIATAKVALAVLAVESFVVVIIIVVVVIFLVIIMVAVIVGGGKGIGAGNRVGSSKGVGGGNRVCGGKDTEGTKAKEHDPGEMHDVDGLD